MKRTTAIVCLSSLLITAGCSDSKSGGGGKSGSDEQQASGAVIKQFADAWVKAWAPNGKPDAAGALTDNPTVFAKRLDDVDSALVASTVTVTPQGEPKCTDGSCTQDLAVEAQLRGIGAMKWTSTATAASKSSVTTRWKRSRPLRQIDQSLIPAVRITVISSGQTRACSVS